MMKIRKAGLEKAPDPCIKAIPRSATPRRPCSGSHANAEPARASQEKRTPNSRRHWRNCRQHYAHKSHSPTLVPPSTEVNRKKPLPSPSGRRRRRRGGRLLPAAFLRHPPSFQPTRAARASPRRGSKPATGAAAIRCRPRIA